MNRTLTKLLGLPLAVLLLLSLFAAPARAGDAKKDRWLKIRVYASGSSTPKVLVNLPMGFVSAAVKVLARSGARVSVDSSLDPAPEGGRAKLRLKEGDLADLLQQIESMDPGQIIEVQDDDERVSIWIE